MEQHRAIPQGYMTVGEIARKMGVTVRTLQYYDKEGVLAPSAESEGGRRLYTHKDIVKLYQIQWMKYLGFSLEDIKTRLPAINTPEEVAAALAEQAKAIREKIDSLTEVLDSIVKLKSEVMQMKTVDWRRYADILVLLQARSDTYWFMKYIEGKLLEHVRSFDEETSGAFMHTQNQLFKKAHELEKKGVCPESKEGQAFAAEFWSTILDFTKGDMSLVSELIKFANTEDMRVWRNKIKFFEKALGTYIANLGCEQLFGASANASASHGGEQ